MLIIYFLNYCSTGNKRVDISLSKQHFNLLAMLYDKNSFPNF